MTEHTYFKLEIRSDSKMKMKDYIKECQKIFRLGYIGTVEGVGHAVYFQFIKELPKENKKTELIK